MEIVAKHNHAAVQEVLREAFKADPVMNWICPDPRFVPVLFSLLTPLYARCGLATLDSERTAACLWTPPGHALRPGLTSLPDALRFLGLCGYPGMRRIRRFSSVSDACKPREPFYYLFAIGVRDSAKGTGKGSAILKHSLQLCDQQSRVAYLENSNEANLGFYQKHGFEVVDEVLMEADGPRVWLMARRPREPLVTQ